MTNAPFFADHILVWGLVVGLGGAIVLLGGLHVLRLGVRLFSVVLSEVKHEVLGLAGEVRSVRRELTDWRDETRSDRSGHES